jgi:hypothetical protein
MDENVLAVVVGLDEAKALLVVKPFYSAHCHGKFLQTCVFKLRHAQR